MLNVWTLILIGLVAMSVVMTTLWLIQRRTHNAGIVDIAWSFGTGLMAVWFAWGVDGYEPRKWIVGILAGLWGARLGFYLLKRVLSEEEDGRYRMLRHRWGDKTQFYLFWFFQIQAAWAVMFALPMLVAAANDTASITPFDIAGIIVWILALGGETIADLQLAAFRSNANSRGRVCDVGLWKYSRHPNYFFEWIHWFAYVLFGITGAWGWLTLFGPAVMLFFLLKVTGVPLTEQRALQSRGDAYREYQRTTNKFFPGPPKRSAAT